MADIEGPGINSEGGISRRELMKRGAIVGGTVLWAAPAIQSLASPALAQRPTRCGCCYCFSGDPNNPDFDHCNDNGDSGPRSDPAACAAYCADPVQSGAVHEGSEQCDEFAGGCTCRQITDVGVDPGENGCACA